MAFKNQNSASEYWNENIKLVLTLLAIWALVSFGCGILLVDILNDITFMGFKLGFWFAQQGSMYVFVALIFVYVAKANALDEKYGVHED
ncbi:DUF4212 domain-containing protein [Psychromonas sp. MME2]|uniref:DUF4212 domain-containing protein n=1 Tax=unclassified Psychromonas TaxID=2614957 RepID=UPI00339CA1E9